MQRSLIINAPALDWNQATGIEARNNDTRATVKRRAAINQARANLQRDANLDAVRGALSFLFMTLSVVLVVLSAVAVM